MDALGEFGLAQSREAVVEAEMLRVADDATGSRRANS
jgi:hypothetical protein